MKIDNGPEKAVSSGKWSRERGKELYGAIANETDRDELGREGFLIFPDDAFKLWPRASGLSRCKYPHHQVRDGELVVSVPGLRAAYARAKQQKVYAGELKAHLDRHLVELGLAHQSGDEIVMEDAQLITEGTIIDNFDEIEAFVEKKQAEPVMKVENVGDLCKTVKTPEELMRWMSSHLEYDDRITEDDDGKGYRLLSPDSLISEGRGVCWDFTELERVWFRKNYPGKFKIFYVAGSGEDAHPCHTFLVRYTPTSAVWFEFSWVTHRGEHIYRDEPAALSDIVRKFKLSHPEADRFELRGPLAVPEEGLSIQAYMDWADTQPKVEIDGLKLTKLTAADYVPVFGIIKSYSQERLRADGSEKDRSEKNSMRFDRIIHALTRGDNYSHALVSLDPSLERMYSFEDEGLEIDGIHDRLSWLGTKSIYVAVMFVTKDERETMQAYLDYLTENIENTSYAMSNLLKMMVGKPVKQDKRFVCSSITGYILSMGNRKNVQRDYSRLRPEDITLLPRAFYVANFSDALDFDRRKAEFTAKIAKLKADNWEEIDEYNNQLPRLLLKDNLGKLKTLDKIFGWVIDRL